MATNTLDPTLAALKKIHFTEENGLVLCDNPDRNNNAEWLHIEERAKKLGASAVLFRRYFNENHELTNSKPSVYIFEKEKAFNSQTETELHAKIWSAGEVDVYMVVGKTELKVINARKPAEITKNNFLSLENLEFWSGVLEKFNDQRFSAHIFGKGMFWEQGTWELDEKQTPFHILLDQLEKTRTKLAKKGLNAEQKMALDRLLLLSILVMFLEEKKDSKGDFALSKKYENYSNQYQTKNFTQILRKDGNGELCIRFINELANKYNGKIFDILTEKEENFIKGQNLSDIALFVEGTTDAKTKQISIWRKYNFDFIPIELISSIYENFLQSETQNQGKSKEKGVVYTPPFLVNFLIDEVMPLNLPKQNYWKEEKISYKVLDPACGSGIFLVAAYKRLLDWWAINNFDKVVKLSLPDDDLSDEEKKSLQLLKEEVSNTFKEILENNIFGVDINETATQITIFSLTIAFLNKIDPKLLWGEFQFKNLSAKNIKDKNFFEWASTVHRDFDLVIGNPPFNFETGKKLEDYIYKKDEKGVIDYTINFTDSAHINFRHPKLPDNNFTLHFFEGAITLGKKVCLIVKSSEFLYSKNAFEYRKLVFSDFNIKVIFDFTPLKDTLFGSAKVSVCTIIAEPQPSKQEPIEHTIINRIINTENKLAFQIDHYDRHFVRWSWAVDENKQFIWKTNLLGGGRLFHLIDRLSMVDKLGQFLENKEKKSKWLYNVGYISEHKNKKKIPANFITGKPTIKPRSFKDDGTYKIITESLEGFVETRNKELYEPPHIILKLVIKDKISTAFVEEYLCFNSSFVGISAPMEDKKGLYEVYERLYQDEELASLYSAFVLATSSKALVYRGDAIIKEDLDNLPYPKDKFYLNPSDSEKIVIKDLLKYYRHLQKDSQGDAKKLYQKVTKTQLENFGKVFCKIMNAVYEQKDESGVILQKWQVGRVYQMPNFTAYEFVYGKIKSKEFDFQEVSDFEAIDESLQKLIFNTEENRGAIYTRVLREYDYIEGYDTLLLVKPNALRYWLKSIALRDADDTIVDYYEVGF